MSGVLTKNRTSLKSKIRNRQKTLGTWVTVAHRSFVELAVISGFDWVCIDIEHSSINLDQLGSMISVGRAAGIDVLVRIYNNDEVIIKRVMDSGASGIIVPMINSKEEALKAYKSMQYPPLGNRGVGLARAQGFGATFEEYKKWLKDEAILIVQIEHINAVNNLESILGVAEVDGYLVGPYDLSASLGKPGDFENPDFKKALDKIAAFEAKGTKARGIHVVDPNHDKLDEAVKKGFDFIAYSFETRVVEQAFAEARRRVQPSGER